MDIHSTNSPALRVALFDFDGVIMNTEVEYSRFWNEQGRIYHPELDNFGQLIKGQTLVKIYDRYFADLKEEQPKITEALNRFEREMPYVYLPGVVDFMAHLRQVGVKTAIVTSSNDLKMGQVHRMHPELRGMVDAILTADRFSHSKPHPECFLVGAETLGARPEECVVFEDSLFGIEAGLRAGMKVVGVSTTFPAETVREKTPYVIPDFTGLTWEKVCNL
jgi:HAD superfamily hydrolase (TIGR01509 family)